MKPKKRNSAAKETDIDVLFNGWWCPAFEAVFPKQCEHRQHHQSESVRCLVVTQKSGKSREGRCDKR